MPVIIYGSRNLTSTKKKGDFHCPKCNTKVNFKWKQVRRWGHMYYIPLFPGQMLAEFVECQACLGTYQPTVLDYDPAKAARAFEAVYQTGMRRVMIQMMLADGAVEAAETQLVKGLHQQLLGQPLSDEQIQKETLAIRQDRRDLLAYLKELGSMLNDKGRSAVIRAAYLVAAADGTFQDAEVALLNRMGTTLGMTGDQIRAAIAELKAPAGRPS